MLRVLPGYVSIVPAPGMQMVDNPFPCGSVLYLLWSAMRDAQRKAAFVFTPWTETYHKVEFRNCRFHHERGVA